MLIFDHVGVTSTVPRPDENWVEASRVWVTDPRAHPEHIEFLRYEPDSPVPEIVKANPHVAFRVAALEPHLAGQEIVIAPFAVGDFLEVAFVWKYNALFEYMHYLREGWFADGTAG